jgi:hypothetical protein
MCAKNNKHNNIINAFTTASQISMLNVFYLDFLQKTLHPSGFLSISRSIQSIHTGFLSKALSLKDHFLQKILHPSGFLSISRSIQSIHLRLFRIRILLVAALLVV